MKKVSPKDILILFSLWFCIIPLVDMGISTFLKDSSILLSVDKMDEKKYKNLNMEEVVSDTKLLFETEFEENKKLDRIINKNAFMKLDFEKDADVMGLYFIKNYQADILKDRKEIKYEDYLSSTGEKAKNILVDPSSFTKLFNLKNDEHYDINHNFKFDINKTKILLNNDKLIDNIKALTYKRYLTNSSYDYGFFLTLAFFTMFTFFTYILEQRYLNTMNVSKKVRDMGDIILQPFSTMFFAMIVLFASLLIGLMFNVLPIYFSGLRSSYQPELIETIFTYINQLFFQIGNVYVNNVPLSRFVLLAMMPVCIWLYMNKISLIDKAVEKQKILNKTQSKEDDKDQE